MLAASLPHVDSWNGWYAWYGNTPDGARELMDDVDAVAVDVGRSPGSFDHTVTVLVEAPGSVGNVERSKR